MSMLAKLRARAPDAATSAAQSPPPTDPLAALDELDALVASEAAAPAACKAPTSLATAGAERGGFKVIKPVAWLPQEVEAEILATAAETGTYGTEAEAVDRVNADGLFVAPLNGEPTIWRECVDPETGIEGVQPMSQAGGRLLYANVFAYTKAPGGGAKRVSVFDIWCKSERRRQYPLGIALDPEGPPVPGGYNLWRGFGAPAVEGDAQPMLAHVEMLCGGDAEQAAYLLNFLAYCVQHPGGRPEVALVLRGGQGTGKGTVLNAMCDIFGGHSLHLTQAKHLTGNFNAHLRSALFVFVDEGYWAGSRDGEGTLKALITEPTVTIEMKGRDVFSVPNRLKLVMASNSAWVVPAGADDRRYAVIDVSNARAQDHGYFDGLHRWLRAGGIGVFLQHLLQRDLSAFNVRAIPRTAALDRQKIESMPAIDRWLLDALDMGHTLECLGVWEDAHPVVCSRASDAFAVYCRQGGIRAMRNDSRAIGKRLMEVFGCGPASGGGRQGGKCWHLPSIVEARQRAARTFGLNSYEWGQA